MNDEGGLYYARRFAQLKESPTNHEPSLSGRVATLHGHLVTRGLAAVTHLASKLIVSYIETKHVTCARKLLDKIPQSDATSWVWIVFIGACSRCGYQREAVRTASEMHKSSIMRLNEYVIPSVVKACAHMLYVRTGMTLHSFIHKVSMESDEFIVSSLIDLYSKCGEVEEARKLFDEARKIDVAVLNAMVSAYAKHSLLAEGLVLVEKMTITGLKPDIVTWNTLISGFAQMGDFVMASSMFESMVKDGVRPDVYTWTSIISGLVQNFCNKEALGTFRKMLKQGVCPSAIAISSLLGGCGNGADMNHGREIHGYAVAIGVEDDITVSSALVDMYGKCSSISDARKVFAKMPEKNTATWNSMIFGCANHGYCEESVDLFDEMEKKEQEKIDHLTFTAVLAACSHAGMVELGKSLFRKMQETYRIAARMEHYACMVDLLGRAGRVREAYSLMKMMPFKPDLFVWGALLGACRIHGDDKELALVAALHLTELEPENAGNNTLVSSLYANIGCWDKVAMLKKMKMNMRGGERKFISCSWIDAHFQTSQTLQKEMFNLARLSQEEDDENHTYYWFNPSAGTYYMNEYHGFDENS